MRRGEFPDLLDAKILIIDDHPPNITLLEYILQASGYKRISAVTDSRHAISSCRDFDPDLVLLDLHMPHVDGFEILRRLDKTLNEGSFLPVLVLTADVSPETKRLALSTGADDFLSKPLDAVEVTLRVRNLLEQRWLHVQKQQQNTILEAKVEQRTHELATGQIEILGRLALAAEYRDDETGQHTVRVGAWSALVAEGLGHSKHDVEILRLAAGLHDIGKIGIPDRVLLKAGPLTPEERNIMQSHTTIGAELLGRSTSPLLQLARQIALCHHERWDGLGYPAGLKAELSPLAARIVAVVDTFDALIHKRPYKPAWMHDRALDEMSDQSGRQFDPTVLRVFFDVVERNDLANLAGHVAFDVSSEFSRQAVIHTLR